MIDTEILQDILTDHKLCNTQAEELKKSIRLLKKSDDIDKAFLDMCKEVNHYRELKEQRRLIELPCKVGDTIWDIDFGTPTASTVVGMSFGNIYQDSDLEMDMEQLYFYSKSNRFNIDTSFPVSEIGKTVFLTKAEAKKVLAERQV